MPHAPDIPFPSAGKLPYLRYEAGPVSGSEAAKGKGQREDSLLRDAMNPSFTSDKAGKAPDGMDFSANLRRRRRRKRSQN